MDEMDSVRVTWPGEKKFEIGRLLHLKSEIRNSRLDGTLIPAVVQFAISDLRCRICGFEAVQLRVAEQYIEQFGKMAKEANNLGFTSQPETSVRSLPYP